MFSIKEAVKFGWKTFRKHSGLMLGVTLSIFALELVADILDRTMQGTALGFMATVVVWIAGIVIGCGATLISLKLAKGEHAHYRDIVPKAAVVWRYFLTSFLSGLIAAVPVIIGGIISFIILAATGSISFSEGPWQGSVGAVVAAVAIMCVAGGIAIFLALRYSMARLVILEHDGVVASIRKSSKLTRDAMGKLFLFVLALVGLNIAGVLALLVGLLVSIPVSMLAFAHVYTKLKHRG